MTNLRLAIAAALLTGAALPALAAETMPAQTNGSAASQAAMNTDGSMGISSEASATQRKGTHLSAAQRAKADAEEAETTRQLNQQAAAMAAPDRTAMR